MDIGIDIVLLHKLAQDVRVRSSNLLAVEPLQSRIINLLRNGAVSYTHLDVYKRQMQYDTGTSAAVAYKSTTYRSFVMGFPLECIIDERTRTSVLLGILKFLTD